MDAEIPEHPTEDEEWGRLPKAKHRLEDLSRTTWMELIYAGHVKSVVIRKGAAQRGIRLVSLTSYRNYLRSLAQQQTAKK
jgi:hypothetical protein